MRKQTMVVSLMLMAAVWVSSANPVGAQVQEEVAHRVEAAARRQLEVDLTSSDHTVRWAALRAISSLEAPWIAEIVLPLCQAPDLGERVIALELLPTRTRVWARTSSSMPSTPTSAPSG